MTRREPDTRPDAADVAERLGASTTASRASVDTVPTTVAGWDGESADDEPDATAATVVSPPRLRAAGNSPSQNPVLWALIGLATFVAVVVGALPTASAPANPQPTDSPRRSGPPRRQAHRPRRQAQPPRARPPRRPGVPPPRRPRRQRPSRRPPRRHRRRRLRRRAPTWRHDGSRSTRRSNRSRRPTATTRTRARRSSASSKTRSRRSTPNADPSAADVTGMAHEYGSARVRRPPGGRRAGTHASPGGGRRKPPPSGAGAW